ncbi:hypothetical protein QAD02_017414 [Eretmocerus hayati]|uniref:Uncharacterized protein n=1 Tax=Eretmocerus hayati TaxID=131215 RepID=A0ACC2PE93_9HYME|nr:hypothetical protein QAD02_017414 [Eretmocerus hayati]
MDGLACQIDSATLSKLCSDLTFVGCCAVIAPNLRAPSCVMREQAAFQCVVSSPPDEELQPPAGRGVCPASSHQHQGPDGGNDSPSKGSRVLHLHLMLFAHLRTEAFGALSNIGNSNFEITLGDMLSEANNIV